MGAPTSTPEIDRHMHPLSFCRKLNVEQFYLILFFYMLFPISVQYNISPYQSFDSPSSTPWGRLTYALADIFVRNSIPSNFYLKLFFVWRLFFFSVGPQLSVFCHFSTISYFNYINLLIPLAPLGGDMLSRSFLYKIQLRKTFTWSFFVYDSYFWQRWAPNWMQFTYFLHHNSSNIPIFRPPPPLAPLPWGDRHMH